MSQMQCFVSIDITDTCQESLVQEQRFQLAVFIMEMLKKIYFRELLIQWLRTQLIQNYSGVGCKPDSPKFSWIDERQPPPILKIDSQPVMRELQRIQWFHDDVATHSQVEKECSICQ